MRIKVSRKGEGAYNGIEGAARVKVTVESLVRQRTAPRDGTPLCLAHKINLILPGVRFSLSLSLFQDAYISTLPTSLLAHRVTMKHNGGGRERSARFKRRRRRVFGIGSRGESRGGLRGSIVKTDSFCSATRAGHERRSGLCASRVVDTPDRRMIVVYTFDRASSLYFCRVSPFEINCPLFIDTFRGVQR